MITFWWGLKKQLLGLLWIPTATRSAAQRRHRGAVQQWCMQGCSVPCEFCSTEMGVRLDFGRGNAKLRLCAGTSLNYLSLFLAAFLCFVSYLELIISCPSV